MDMREKIARAIGDRYEVSGQRGDLRAHRPSEAVLLDCADTVLEAMREPDDLMGLGLRNLDGYKPGSHSATQIWRAMIDAARTKESV